ncbi:class I SAM-dependent methyltransferase [Arsenicibacter rosenii]|nr:class I SAM-dependent methyltransferase [Arsenicibacter rosenii]
MFRLEEQLWWYRILHESVLKAIQKRFGNRRDIRIFDAGCGTGGLLHFLKRHGYAQIQGVDGSADGVAFCRERTLHVDLLDLTRLEAYQPDTTIGQFDVVVCDDVFCYFDDQQLTKLILELGKRLKPDGLLISNNNAFNVFWGSHDLAVGSKRRFVRQDFARLLPGTAMQIQFSTYWSLFLSPLILAVRQLQALKLRLGARPEEQGSDVYMPGEWINKVLYGLVRFERTVLPRTPFGSSLFLVLTKTN